jgi:hypothetical protein
MDLDDAASLREWKLHDEHRALGVVVLDPNIAAVQVDERSEQVQPELAP